MSQSLSPSGSTTSSRHPTFESLGGKKSVESLTQKPVAGNETSYFDFQGVRISPEAIIFKDVFDGDTKRIVFTLQNVKRVPALVKICPPNSYAFRLSSPLKTCLLAPGLTVSRTLSYINLRHAYTRSMLELFINDEFVEYPIIVNPANPHLFITPAELDFGVVDVGSSAVVRTMQLNNDGAVGSKFSVDLGTNDLDIVVSPLRGVIRAHAEVKIIVELVGIHEGVFYKEFWIKSASRPIRIPTTVNVNLPHLIVFHPNTTGDFTLIDFEPTYFGTKCHESMVVRNISAQISTFVVLAEINNELHPLRDVAEMLPEFGMFTIEPSEGRMEPFEGRIFTLNFHPVVSKQSPKTGWKRSNHEEMSKDFLVFVRILRVQCMDITDIEKSLEHFKQEEPTMDITASGLLSTYDNLLDIEKELSTTVSSISHMDKLSGVVLTGPIVRLCLHGEAIVPSIELQPTAIDFGTIRMDFVETRVLCLRNPSPLLTIHYRYKKVFSFEVLPPEGKLGPLESVEVVINATPVRMGLLEQSLVFELLGQTMPLLESSKRIVVSRGVLDVKFLCPSVTTKLRPQFNQGISPHHTVHEVGKSTEIVTFKTPSVKIPKSIMQQCRQGDTRPWAVKPPKSSKKEVAKKAKFLSTSAMSTRKIEDTRCTYTKPKPPLTQLSLVPADSSRKVVSTHSVRCTSANVREKFNVKIGDNTSRNTSAPPSHVGTPMKKVELPKGRWIKESMKNFELPKGRWMKEPMKVNYYKFVVDTPSVKTKKDIYTRVTTANRRLCQKTGDQSEKDPLIAFPNDRARSNRPWPKDEPCKTIFKGIDRYAQPKDSANTYNEDELAYKRIHDNRYAEFTRSPMRRRIAKQNKEALNKTEDDNPYDIGCEYSVYKLLRMKPPKPYHKSKGADSYPAEVHVPLTPLQLYNVKVKPHAINFGKVAPKSNSSEVLYLENLNNFAVKIKIMPGRSGVLLPKGDVKILKGHTKIALVMVYNAESLGRYNGFMDYVINDNHSFEVTVTAEVVSKSLMLKPTELIFGQTSSEEAFQPKFVTVGIINPLHAYTKFHWEVPENSSFTPKPMSGVVPPKRMMLCEMKKTPNPFGPQCSELILRSESGIYMVLKCCLLPRKCRVTFTEAKMDVGEIPLHLLTIKTAFMYNPNYEDMMFKVVNPCPIPGCDISPMGGVIKARSFHALDLKLKLGAVVDFEFKVDVLVQRTTKLALEVKGYVSYPKVVLTPDILHLRRISADSFDIIRMSAENQGTTNVELSFNLEDFPEYHLSPSRKKSVPFFTPDGFNLRPGKIQQFYLHFYPVDVATYHFLLPMIVNGILGAPDIDIAETQKPRSYMALNEKLLQNYGNIRHDDIPKKLSSVRIDCTVAGHILTFSKLELYFKHVPGCVQRSKVDEDVRVSNEYRNPVTFCIRIDDLHEETSVFSLRYHCGKPVVEEANALIATLEPGEFVVLRASFTPLYSGNYNVAAPIYIRKYGFGNVFNYLHFEGQFPPPEIKAMKSELIFLPVPLDVEVEKVIILDCVNHPENAEVSAVIAPGEDAMGRSITNVLRVKFIQSNVITGMQGHVFLPVLVIFKSSTPISFNTSIKFTDTLQGQDTIAVTATADCCTLTTHAFQSIRFEPMATPRGDDAGGDSILTSKFSRDDGQLSPQQHSGTITALKPEGSLFTFNSPFIQRRSTAISAIPGIISSLAMRAKVAVPPPANKISAHSSYDINLISDMLEDLEDEEDADESEDNNIKMSESIFTIYPHTNYQERIDPSHHYPKFPLTNEDSEYAKHMKGSLEAAETWLFEQGYRCAFAASIPDGLTAMLGGFVTGSGSGTKAKFRIKSILELLINLVGPTVQKNFPKQPEPESDQHRVKLAYERHKQLLTFLNYQGACLAHIKPKYLFNYADYVTYKKRVRTQPNKNPDLENPPVYEVNPHQRESYSDDLEPEDQLNEIPGSPFISNANPPHHDIRHRYDPDCPSCLELVPESTFERLCKQAWLDVILQIFKTLVLSKITLATVTDTFMCQGETRRASTQRPNVLPSQQVLSFNAARHQLGSVRESIFFTPLQRQLQNQIKDPAERKIYSESELILLKWLNTHFDKQRTLIWAPVVPAEKIKEEDSKQGFFDSLTTLEEPINDDMESQYMPDERKVTNFDIDLSDGLVLAAVTASYCPYLVPIYFTDLYLHPESQEQAYHNAARLTEAWNDIRLGFSITPTDIVIPNSILLLMLTTSLYSLLPTMYPKTIIEFQTGLTSEVTRQIQLVNQSPRRIGYTLKFIGDGQDFFSHEKQGNSSTIYIQAHEKITLSVGYEARKIGVVKTTLVLCGSTISPNFAQHLVFTLEGEPIHLQTSETFALSAPLYRPTSVDLPIRPPYPGGGEYEILCTEVEPTNSEDFVAQPWRELRKRKVPRRLYLHKGRLIKSPSEETAPLGLTVACLAPTTRIFWLAFVHPEIGDFIIKIVIIPRTTETMATIQAPLPFRWRDAQCICTLVWATRELGMENCPCRSVIHMPCRSEELLYAVRTMFEKTLEEKERDFWSHHLETNIGLRLIEWLLGEVKDSVSEEFSHIFCTSVTYHVVCSAPNEVRVPEKLTIPDFRVMTTIAMPIHVSPSTPFPFHVNLMLTSENQKEIRNYRVNFKENGTTQVREEKVDISPKTSKQIV